LKVVFGCQKCLYCGIDLRIKACNCNKQLSCSETELVKNAFPKVFDSASNPKQLDFIKNENESFTYGFDLTKSFQFSFCSTCNYQRLSDKKSKSNNFSQKARTSKNVPQLEKKY
jgi:hypothetical protein